MADKISMCHIAYTKDDVTNCQRGFHDSQNPCDMLQREATLASESRNDPEVSGNHADLSSYVHYIS